MKKVVEALKQDNIGCGYLYFYIHFITEVVCFFYLSRVTNNSMVVWLIPFIYDGLAFVPQALIGYVNDKHPKFKSGLVGVLLLIIAYLIYIIFNNIYLSLIVISLGNAFIHISGAECTLKNSKGKLSHSAIFVGGGSFGVITGRVLSLYKINPIIMIFLIITMIPYIMLADTYYTKNSKVEFDYHNKNVSPIIILILSILVVIIRGYMGYGIPTSWNKTLYQTIILFCIMGVGKCLGGILSDAYGIRKVGMLSTLAAIPFLLFGDNNMFISLIGVMFFSMTMSITLALLGSIYKTRPGLAFGFTTIGLFLGTAPIFFIQITNTFINIIMIIVLSILCSIILSYLLKKEV